MKPGPHDFVLGAARLFAPVIALFAFALLALREAGDGVGLLAGFAFAMALALHALVFGANAARAAFPAVFARLLLGTGLIATLIAAGAPDVAFAAQIGEAGLFASTGAGAALILAVCMARAPTLRDEDW
jgi:hypothetical protein